MFDKISMLLFETTIPVLSMIHPILGTGLPVALHSSVTSSPSRTGEEHWRDVTFGATEKHKMQIWALDWNHSINSSFYDGRFLLQNVKQKLLTKQIVSDSYRSVNSETIFCLTAVTTRLNYLRSLLRFIRYKFFRCRLHTIVSFFCPCDVWFWIASYIAEPAKSNCFLLMLYNLMDQWQWHDELQKEMNKLSFSLK